MSSSFLSDKTAKSYPQLGEILHEYQVFAPLEQYPKNAVLVRRQFSTRVGSPYYLSNSSHYQSGDILHSAVVVPVQLQNNRIWSTFLAFCLR